MIQFQVWFLSSSSRTHFLDMRLSQPVFDIIHVFVSVYGLSEPVYTQPSEATCKNKSERAILTTRHSLRLAKETKSSPGDRLDFFLFSLFNHFWIRLKLKTNSPSTRRDNLLSGISVLDLVSLVLIRDSFLGHASASFRAVSRLGDDYSFVCVSLVYGLRAGSHGSF